MKTYRLKVKKNTPNKRFVLQKYFKNLFFHSTKKLGKGQFTFGTGNRTGDSFGGDFYQGEFHGNGTYTYANGDRFVGQFRFGKRNGVGTLYKQDGETIPGRWRNGQLVAEVFVKYCTNIKAKKVGTIFPNFSFLYRCTHSTLKKMHFINQTFFISKNLQNHQGKTLFPIPDLIFKKLFESIYINEPKTYYESFEYFGLFYL